MGKGLQVRTRTSNQTKGFGIQIRTQSPGGGLQIDSTRGSYRKIPITELKKAKISRLSYF